MFVIFIFALIGALYPVSYLIAKSIFRTEKILWTFLIASVLWIVLITGFYSLAKNYAGILDAVFVILLPWPHIAGLIALIILIIKKINKSRSSRLNA